MTTNNSLVNGPWLYRRGELWALNLDDPDLPPPAEPRIQADFREVTTGEAGALAAAMGYGDGEPVLRRLTSGRRCFAAWVGDDPASYCWISQGREEVGEMERVIRMLDGEAYVWDCATLPAYRRRGLYTAVLGFINRRLGREGLNCIWIGANLENVPSLRAFQKVGYRPVTTLTYARFLGLYLFISAAAPQAPPELVAAARRLFRLDHPPSLGPVTAGWHWPEL